MSKKMTEQIMDDLKDLIEETSVEETGVAHKRAPREVGVSKSVQGLSCGSEDTILLKSIDNITKMSTLSFDRITEIYYLKGLKKYGK